jgi:hypothetical protein
MPFIGNQPALSYTSFAKQDFTTSATTSYTLDNPVANANELALFINFVRQEPTTAYTASGTSLTLTSATSATDDMYCVYLGKAVQTVNPPSGSVGISQLSATGTKDATTFLRGDNTFASAGGTNTPAFRATMSSNQTISNTTSVVINFNTEDFDTDNAYNNSTYTFTCPSGEDGKYFLGARGNFSLNDLDIGQIFLQKNGTNITSTYTRVASPGGGSLVIFQTTSIITLSASDNITAAIYHDYGSDRTLDANYAEFYGYKLIG